MTLKGQKKVQKWFNFVKYQVFPASNYQIISESCGQFSLKIDRPPFCRKNLDDQVKTRNYPKFS